MRPGLPQSIYSLRTFGVWLRPIEISTTATEIVSGNYRSTSEFSMNVPAVDANAAPVNVLPGAQSVNEDTVLAIAGISVNDTNGNLAGTRLTVNNGTLTVDLTGGASISAGVNGGNTLTVAGTQAQINSALATLVYQGNLNFDGGDSLTVFSTDLTGATDSDVVAITVGSVNDAPVLSSVALTLSEGQTVTLALADIGVTDPDNASFTFTASAITGGFFQLSSAPGTPVTSFTTAQLSGGQVQFVDDGNELAPSFNLTANDGTLNSNTLAATISYSPVNDPPVLEQRRPDAH